jgi:hypothetical protein
MFISLVCDSGSYRTDNDGITYDGPEIRAKFDETLNLFPSCLSTVFRLLPVPQAVVKRVSATRSQQTGASLSLTEHKETYHMIGVIEWK